MALEAILSSPTFDATQVDLATVSPAGANVKLIGKGSTYACSVEDVNGDSLPPRGSRHPGELWSERRGTCRAAGSRREGGAGCTVLSSRSRSASPWLAVESTTGTSPAPASP